VDAARAPLPVVAAAPPPPVVTPPRADLAAAVLATLAYADVFSHPLTAEEVHRFLVASRATPEEVSGVLRLPEVRRHLGREGECFTLASGAGSVALRRRRQQVAVRMWPRARRWAKALACLPFVRLVAVTGALAVDAVDLGADIDFLIVARSGRVWLCRVLVTALARASRMGGAPLCPNYVLSEAALAVEDRSLYTAHELVQMVPLAGPQTWRRLCEANAWVADFLPNAGWGASPRSVRPAGGAAARLLERLLGGRLGDRLEATLERWQVAHLERKIARGQLRGGEAAFGRDGYKGHFDAHGVRILAAWRARVDRFAGAAG